MNEYKQRFLTVTKNEARRHEEDAIREAHQQKRLRNIRKEAWANLIRHLSSDINNVKSTLGRQRPERVQTLTEYHDFICALRQALRWIEAAHPFTPAQFARQYNKNTTTIPAPIREIVAQRIPNSGFLWTDWANEGRKHELVDAWNRIPPAPHAKKKELFKAYTPEGAAETRERLWNSACDKRDTYLFLGQRHEAGSKENEWAVYMANAYRDVMKRITSWPPDKVLPATVWQLLTDTDRDIERRGWSA